MYKYAAARRGRACRYDVIKITLGFTACRLITTGRSDTILAMINTNENKWYQHSYVCTDCDGLWEITIKSNIPPNVHCTEDGQLLTLLSVVSATIYPTTKKEDANMETLTPAQTMTLTWQNNGIDETTTYTENDVRSAMYNNRRYAEKQNEWYKKESQLRTLLEEVYADSSEQDTLAQIAEIFDVPLTKEIEVTAWVRVDMTIEVDMAEGNYDIEDMVRNNLSVDAYSPISVNDFDVDRVEENY